MGLRRILHTSDWHLGQSFHGFDRTWEHERWLDWLVDTLGRYRIDALCIAGDIFDTPNPSSLAQRQWFDLLGRVVRAYPACDIVAIAGNHDSPQRIDAPQALTASLGIHIVGSARDAHGQFRPERLVVPLGTRHPEGVWGFAAAVPFLRGDDLGTLAELQADGAGVELTRRRLDAVFTHMDSVASSQHARVALAHAVVTGELSASTSERDIRIGNVEGIPVDVFPASLAYVALGHLHRPQRAGGRNHVQYAGSPLPLHVSEADYAHRVVVATFDGPVLTDIESVAIPKGVTIVRVPPPTQRALPDDVLRMLEQLPRCADLPVAQRPFVDVRFVEDAPRPTILEEVAKALEGKGYRLTGVRAERNQQAPGAVFSDEPTSLASLSPEEVFVELYRRKYKGSLPSEALVRAFRDLVAEVHDAEKTS